MQFPFPSSVVEWDTRILEPYVDLWDFLLKKKFCDKIERHHKFWFLSGATNLPYVGRYSRAKFDTHLKSGFIVTAS